MILAKPRHAACKKSVADVGAGCWAATLLTHHAEDDMLFAASQPLSARITRNKIETGEAGSLAWQTLWEPAMLKEVGTSPQFAERSPPSPCYTGRCMAGQQTLGCLQPQEVQPRVAAESGRGAAQTEQRAGETGCARGMRSPQCGRTCGRSSLAHRRCRVAPPPLPGSFAAPGAGRGRVVQVGPRQCGWPVQRRGHHHTMKPACHRRALCQWPGAPSLHAALR